MPEGERNDQIFAKALEKKKNQKKTTHIKGLHKRQVITRNGFAQTGKKKRYKEFIFWQSSLSTTPQSPKEKEVREGRGEERGADDNSR